MNKKPEAALTAAARALDEDLERFESLSQELLRQPVNSEKSLQRARHALEGCSEHEAKLAASLTAFAQAMQSIGERQQRCMQLVAEASERIQTRHAERSALFERVAALGAQAKAVSSPIAELTEAADTASPQMLASVQEVAKRLAATIEEAGEVARAAKESDWADIARDAEALQQQLQAVHNRVLLSQRKLASQAPS